MSDYALDRAGAEIDLAAMDLDAREIKLSPPRGRANSRNGWVIIGAVAILAAGSIEVIPRKELMRTQLDYLVATAAKVWLFGKPALQGWKWVPARGWVALVGMRYPAFPSSGSEKSSSMSASVGVNPLMVAVPSAR